MAGIGSTPSLVVGIAAGAAASAALEPALEVPKQEAWASAPNRLPDIGLIASLYVAGEVSQADAYNMAARLGFSNAAFNAFAYIAQEVPDWPVVLRMWRLASFNPDFVKIDSSGLVDHALAHAGVDWDYQPYLRALKTAELPGIGDIAYAIVRGILPSPSYVPVPPPTTSTNVLKYPQLNIDPEALAGALGYSPEMLELMVGRSGLSMAPVMAAQAYFRGILAEDDYELAIAEGDLRTEWAGPVKEAARAIPSPGEFAELRLRGWIDQPTSEAGAALHGMSPANTELLYQLKRRPLSPHQIKQALARGAVFDTTNAPFTDPYTSSVHEANLGPEWYDMAISLQGAYPSLFVTNRLVTGGTITPDTGKLWRQKAGDADEVVTALYDSWTGTGSTAATPHASKAATQLWTTTHSAYKSAEIGQTDAASNLTTLGVSATEQAQVFTYWNAERATIRKQLSVAQLQKAEKDGLTNPATGAPFTSAEVVTALVDRGYSQDDAETLAAGA